MNKTKLKILLVSLDLFSQRGYSSVSIRDICKIVGIKESSIYYHFKNKQAIFDEIICLFKDKANGMMNQFVSSLSDNNGSLDDEFYMVACNHFFEDYLIDDFCNKVIRLMLIEQFNNEEVKKIYDYWMFTEPLKYQSIFFQMLINKGILSESDSSYIALRYYAPIFFYAQKWLFSGELSEDRKNSFRQDSYKHIKLFFSSIGGSSYKI